MEEYSFSAVSGFNFFIHHGKNKIIGDATELDGQHIHNMCEIYVNVSGDVSFMVENNIYPVKVMGFLSASCRNYQCTCLMFLPELSLLEVEFGSYLLVPAPPSVHGTGPAQGRLLLLPTG